MFNESGAGSAKRRHWASQYESYSTISEKADSEKSGERDRESAFEDLTREDILDWFNTVSPAIRRSVLEDVAATRTSSGFPSEHAEMAQSVIDSMEADLHAASKPAPPAAKAKAKAKAASGAGKAAGDAEDGGAEAKGRAKAKSTRVSGDPEDLEAGRASKSVRKPPKTSFDAAPAIIEVETEAADSSLLASTDKTPLLPSSRDGAKVQQRGKDESVRTMKMALVEEGHSANSLPFAAPADMVMYETGADALPSLDQFCIEPVVQFAGYHHYAMEGEANMVLEVIRVGDLQMQSSVNYTTVDGSGKAGIIYRHTEGELVFEPGESVKQIKIDLIDDDSWHTTMEFGVVLLAETVQNATLGRYLNETRVSVADNDAFPTNAFSEAINHQIATRSTYFLGKLVGVPRWLLMIEYFKLNCRDPIIASGTLKMLLLGQLHNMYLTLKLLLNVYMVDYVLKLERDEGDLMLTRSREESLLLVTLITVIPFGVLHYLDYYRFSWKVRGLSRKVLQGAIIRKFLNYKKEVRDDLSQGMLILAMTRDATQMVDFGFMNLFQLCNSLGGIAFMLLYQFVAPYVFNKPLRLTVILPMLFYPVCLSVYMRLRFKLTTNVQEHVNDCMDEYIHHTDNIVLNYQVISEYDNRAPFVKKFEDRIVKYNQASTSTDQVLENNAYFPQWLGLVLVGLYTVKGGMDVLNNTLSLGTFLIDLHIFQALGVSWGKVYSVLMAMQGSMPCMERVTTLLNFPIDIPQRMSLHRFRRRVTRESVEDLAKQNGEGIPEDMLPIRVTGISTTHLLLQPHSRQTEADMAKQILVAQGRLIYLLGPHGEGKSVLLRYLSGTTLTATDKIPPVFVPAHMRCLHVSAEPLFFEGSLYDNLTLGVRPGDPDGEMLRVLSICRRLGMPRSVRDMIQHGEVHMWEGRLSLTQRQLLSIARAFISNPEFLCVQKPVQFLDEFTGTKVLELFREYVDRRGIDLDNRQLELRRPRTIVITSNRKLSPKLANIVAWVNEEDGIQLYKNQETV